MYSKTTRKNYVPFSSYHGYSSILFALNICEISQCYIILLLWLTLKECYKDQWKLSSLKEKLHIILNALNKYL